MAMETLIQMAIPVEPTTALLMTISLVEVVGVGVTATEATFPLTAPTPGRNPG